MNENLKLIIAAVVVTVGCSLLIASFVVPPLGVVDNSVLAALGELLTFAGACLGMREYYALRGRELDLKK